MGRLIIAEGSVYEIDEKCIKEHAMPPDCDTLKKLRELESSDKDDK